MIEQEIQVIEIASDMRYVILLNHPMPLESVEVYLRQEILLFMMLLYDPKIKG